MKKHLHWFKESFKLIQLVLVISLTLGSLFSFATEHRYTDSWGKQGLSMKRQSTDNLSLNFSMQQFSFEDRIINGITMQGISFSESFLPGEEGSPDLPGLGRYIAIPQGATPVLEIVNMRIERFYDIDIAPSPRIPLDTDDSPLQYAKNSQVYSKNAFYPAQPVQLDDFTQIRGVDVCMLSIQPYQYNPVTKELLVYRDIEINITFEGGSRQYGENKYRSPWWDAILEDAIFNYSSLPVIDYDIQTANKTRSTGYDYLIIVPNDPMFSIWADSISKFRNEEGIYTGIVKLSDIGTNVSAAMLETYINTAYNTWDIPPSAVLLLGDYGQATANTNSITSPIYDNYCVSDNILADVNGNHMPDIVFARITAQNEAQLNSMVSRFLNYERTPPTNPTFYDRPITALGWQTERWFQICSEVVGGFWKNTMGKNPVRINAIYQGTPGQVWSSAQNTNTVVGVFGPDGLGYIPATPAVLGGWSGGTAAMVNTALNEGSFMLMHRDHGMETGWGEPSYTNSSINGLTNTDLSWILSINCLTGKYNYNSECFTEKFHRYTYNGNPAGALGLTAASEVSYSFVNDTYVWGMMDNMWPNFMPQYGTTPESRGVLPAFGNAAGKYFLKQSSWPYNTSNKEVTYHLFHHHGDAFIKICTEVPQFITSTFEPTIYENETEIVVTTASNAKICVSANGVILGTGTTGFVNVVTITIPSQPIGTRLKVTVTKPNCNRNEGYIDVIEAITSATAGADTTICENLSYQLNGIATNYQSLLWETSGTGSFDDATILNPIYTPDANDIQAGSVILSLTAINPAVNDSTDHLTLTFALAPVINAGENASVCVGDSYSTSNATAYNYTELAWTTSGTGTFSDIYAVDTRYTPSEQDITNGNVVLTLTANNAYCTVTTSELPIQINPKPVVTMSGASQVCQYQSDVIYTAGSTDNTYVWEVLGGTISSQNGNEINVSWGGEDYCVITLFETNEFGCSNTIDNVITMNLSPSPVIEGLSNVCANAESVIYTSPLIQGNTYEWQAIGGQIVSGNNTNEVTVNWGENGNGSLLMIETNPANLCSGVADYGVTIASPVITISNDTTICVNHSVTLSTDANYEMYSWTNGGTTNSIEISGSTIGAGNTNTYTVTVSDNDGCSSEASVTVTVESCLGIPESILADSFTIYPNPNYGDFALSFKDALTGKANVTILTTSGTILQQRMINITHSTNIEYFTVSNLSSGIYFIKVQTANGSAVKKLVIQ